MREALMPLESVFPGTKYFEVESNAVGTTFGVWVTTPPGYDPTGSDRYPAIFTPDGNLSAPLFIPYVGLLSGGAGGGDLINPIKPFILVTIGYCGSEDVSFRFRDLLPPGEPIPPIITEAIDGFVAKGDWTPEMREANLARMRDTHADNFLRFITEELFPEITTRWRIDPETTGFFGDSYGGLFATWLALQKVKEFPIVGAGSPGIVNPESKVFEVFEQNVRDGSDYAGHHLHFSYPDREFTATSYFQPIAEQYIRLLHMMGRRPLKGLTVTTHTVPFESHMTGVPANFFSFLRTCYGRSNP